MNDAQRHSKLQGARNLADAEIEQDREKGLGRPNSGDDLRSELLAEISRLNLQDHVQFLGAVDDATLVRLYGGCDVAILPVLSTTSDVEGFGIVLIEAAAAGKPVVATRRGGIPDAVEDCVTGFLV